MFPNPTLTTTKLVESLYWIVIPVLTATMPVDSLWSFSKPVLTIVIRVFTIVKPVECLWRMVLLILTTTESVNPLSTEFHFLEVLLRLLIPCIIRISTSAIS